MKQLNYYCLSKYTFNSLNNYPKINKLNYNVIIHYKQKNKFFLFINILCSLIFFNNNIKTRFYFKNTTVNVLNLNLRNEKAIYKFVTNYIYIYLPLIDSFSAEFKTMSKTKNIITFCFFKFPLFFELNILFSSMEYLVLILNNYKFQLEFSFKNQKNNLINYNLLHFLKLPLIIN